MPNSVPTLINLTSNTTFEEQLVNAGPQLIDPSITFIDIDGIFTAGQLVVSGALVEDTIGIRNQGIAAGQIGVSGGNVTFGGTIFASFTGGAAGAVLRVTFNASATTAAIDALVQNLTYANSSNAPTASRDLYLSISDAAGAAAQAPLVFAEQTGVSSPFTGIDIGADSATTFADLDGDGDQDMLVGEADGTLRYFRNTGTAVAPTFTEQVGVANPFNGIDVDFDSAPIFADLDSDGDLDVFVGETSGTINYYRNTGTAIAPAFTEQVGAANPFNGFDVGSSSSPAFVDVDGDGDLDAFIGETDGIINYFRNTGTAVAPVFTIQTGVANPFNGVDIGNKSTLTFGDIDDDGDQDAFFGNQNGSIIYYLNTGTATSPVFAEQVAGSNPFNGVTVGSESTPTLVDIDGDRDLDLVIGEGDGTINYFRNNTPPPSTQQFVAVSGASNPLSVVAVGQNTIPAFVDIDGDGDLDAFIGQNQAGDTNFFRNTGTALAPVFVLQSNANNPLKDATLNITTSAAPTFVDIDGDGDQDAFIGKNDGSIGFFRNTGTALAPVFAEQTGVGNPLNLIDIGDLANPSFVDIDGDGDQDAFIGDFDGKIDFLRNIGTALAPVFTEQAGALNPFNTVDIGFRSSPRFVDVDGDGDQDAVIGEVDGVINFFLNTGTALAPVFTLQTGANNPFNAINIGNSSVPTFADIDGDGDQDAFVGEFDGDINFFRNTGGSFKLTVNVTAQNESPYTEGNDVIDLNTFNRSNFHLPDLFSSLGGNDTITLSNTFTLGISFRGGAGNDVIIGGTMFDFIQGGDDDDTLVGGLGFDTLDGGAGNDILIGGLGNDSFVVDSNLDGIVEVSGEGMDTVFTTADFTQLDAGNTLENMTYIGTSGGTLFGNSLANFMTGGSGSDNLNGLFGVDSLFGANGDDFFYIDEQDFMDGGAGFDAVYIQTTVGTAVNLFASQVEFAVGFTGNDTLNGSSSTVSVALLGGDGADVLRGGSGNDFLYFDSFDTVVDAGGGNNDVVVVFNDNNGVTLDITAANAEYVIGGNGNDVLNATGSANAVVIQGGSGADTITGGNGDDFFYGDAGADIFRVTLNSKIDAILDFVDTGGVADDRINVSALGASFNTIAEILAATTETSGTSVINFGGGNQLLLFQIAKASLTGDDFIF
ncbi:MAG: beta strand repeat-containing protein [Beijerinckiaceae bacterium]